MIVTLVLNTDMMFHLTIIDDAEQHTARWAESDALASLSVEGTGFPATQPPSRWHNPEFRTAAMSLLIHAADINSAGRRPDIAGMWAHAIYQEFFRQGDLEIEQDLPQTPFFQRDKVVIWKAQVWQRSAHVRAYFDMQFRRHTWVSIFRVDFAGTAATAVVSSLQTAHTPPLG